MVLFDVVLMTVLMAMTDLCFHPSVRWLDTPRKRMWALADRVLVIIARKLTFRCWGWLFMGAVRR